MTYTAKTAGQLKRIAGSMIEKIATEFGLIDAEIDTHKVHTVHLTAGLGTPTAQATTGVDLADGNDTTYYAVFVPPSDITITEVYVLMTEDYVEDTDAGSITLSAPKQGIEGLTICTIALPGTGIVADSGLSGTISGTNGNVNAGKRLDITVVATGSSSGTGHAVVMMEYINR